MNFESIIKFNLRLRGFTDEQLLDNRGLITATIDETIVLTTKANHKEK